jgi:hypothetical protein
MTPLRAALLLLALCAVAAWQVTQIPESAMQMAVGATLVPALITAGLSICAALYGLSAWQGKQVDESDQSKQSPQPGSTARLACLLGGGAVFMSGVPYLGFVIPATACGMLIARSFESPLNLRSMTICGAIALTFWVLFALVLGVGLGPALPAGF